MSSVTSTNSGLFSSNIQERDTAKLTLNTNNNKLVIENNSNDVTISKFETSSTFSAVTSTNSTSIPLKTQVLPLVYIQNHSKMPFATVNKTTNNSNSLISQFQFTTIGQNNNTPVTTVSVQTNQNVVFASGKPQSLILQKPLGNIVPSVGKITGTYVTMLKPISKSAEQLNMNKLNLAHTKNQENNVSKNGFIQGTNQPQKIVFAPMPKVLSSRPPVTATTNSVQPKIALLPMPVPKNELTVAKQKIYNFQINEGNFHSENPASVTVVSKNWEKKDSNDNSTDIDSDSDKNLICDEIFNMESPQKNDISNKSYELSIMEESLSNQSDVRLVVSSVDSNSSSGDQKTHSFKIENKQKELPKFSHGVSILKKNFSNCNISDRKLEKSNSNNNNNNSEVSVSESDINVSKTIISSDEKNLVTTISYSSAPKPERRRKSQFSLRKDFDDMDIVFTTETKMGSESVDKSLFDTDVTITKCKEEIKKEEEVKKEKVEEIDLSEDTKYVLNIGNEFDAQKILKWDDGIGSLPGSNLKFIINEFNIIEYVTEEDHKKIIERRLERARERMKIDSQEEIRCLECGCYGLRSDFVSPKYCSYDCQGSAGLKSRKDEMKIKKKKKKIKKTESNTDIKIEIKPESGSDEENSNDTIQDKFTYPWACKKKGFSWSKYLDHIKAKPAPVKLFKDPFPYTRNGFRPGMKLEGVDPQHTSYFCVLTVAEIMGYRVRLHFDGYPENYDYWCNADSMDIFPMGWCEKYGHVLQPPPGYTIENFNWMQYLKITRSTAAPKHLFTNRAGQAICPNGFRVGMKLEAVDRKNTSLVCVASVRDMMDNRILVHFDSWDDIYDYWADPTSPYIHPVGWCDQYGHNLTPPNDYPNPETFSWEVYLKETKAVAAPVRAFKQRPACGFRRGMRLECVDKRVPQLIRVATVDDVKEHQIRIHFDGWPDRYSYWVDDDSPDIHPVGWCQKTGHPIEPPLTPDDVYDFLECPTVGCRGQGHTQGPKYSTHSIQKFCPYAEENIDVDKVLPDRLLSPDRSPQAVVPVSREPKECKIKPRLGRPPKYLKQEILKNEVNEEPPEKKQKRKYNKRKKSENSLMRTEEQKAVELIEMYKVLPVEKESWERHSQFLRRYVDSSDNPQTWTKKDVVDFISSLPGCENQVDIFMEENIDGESLLLLSQKDILTILKMKVGPAVKLYNSIVLLRQLFLEEKVFA